MSKIANTAVLYTTLHIIKYRQRGKGVFRIMSTHGEIYSTPGIELVQQTKQ